MTADEQRARIRAADPHFTELVDRLRALYGEKNVKVRALVTNDGREFGTVTDDMREAVK